MTMDRVVRAFIRADSISDGLFDSMAGRAGQSIDWYSLGQAANRASRLWFAGLLRWGKAFSDRVRELQGLD
jgi:hypothetical protein